MKPLFNGDDVVARRIFESEAGPVELRIHRPQPWPSDTVEREPDWVCWYSIHFPGGEIRQGGVAGVDSIQAMLLSFASAAGALRYVGDGTSTRRPPLQWLDDDDLGLTINHFD
ncbi:hypothetical protein GCM10022268_27420 [Sphingomonas cynarae]|uniref:DUF6968 domain-containing protein n=1 Tax=Sphingomonas cynarae TaxID=930197 RepID=A0ABP7ECV4_9SPHN